MPKKKTLRKPRKAAPVKTTAIVPVAPSETIVRRRELHFSREQIDLIKENVAKGTSDEQLQYFLYVCKKHRLDPLAKQIYCVLWPRNGGGHDMVIITGINGFRTTAARDHKDFAGTSKAMFVMSDRKTPTANRPIPESCVMQGFKKTSAGIQLAGEMEIYWDEFAPAVLTDKRADFWRMRPRHMLQKCCEAQLLRKLYPDLSDVYVEEELTQRMQDFTPGGREISVDGVNPSGQIASGLHGSRQAAQAVLAEKLAGKGTEGVPGAAWKREQELRADRHPIDVKASQGQPESQRPMRHATLDWTNAASPILTGDIADLVPKSKAPYGLLKGLNLVWGADSFWHVGLDAVKDLRAICAESGYELTELHPKGSGVKGKPEAKPSGASTKPNVGADNAPKRSQTDPITVSGTIERTNMSKAGPSPVQNVSIVLPGGKKDFLSCFHKSMWPEIEKGLGKLATFRIVQKGNFKNIERLLKIGSKEWLEDGTPAIQNSTREAGGKTLFG